MYSGFGTQSKSIGVIEPSALRACTVPSEARSAWLGENEVLVIPSGPKMLSWRYLSIAWPLTASMT